MNIKFSLSATSGRKRAGSALGLASRAFLFVALIALGSVMAHADPGDFTYSVSGGEATITGYTGPGGDLVIPELIDGYPVTVIGLYVFLRNSDIEGVPILVCVLMR